MSCAAVISSHAPPRGATTHAFPVTRAFPISIHAPPRGATKPTSSHSSLGINFNSRPSARGDPPPTDYSIGDSISIHAPPRGATASADVVQLHKLRISIHAPPRGATRTYGSQGRRGLCYFNSRPSARGDRCSRRSFGLMGYFNSRPSARGDLSVGDASQRHDANFNSRPSARGDFSVSVTSAVPKISIHAPPRGATTAL